MAHVFVRKLWFIIVLSLLTLINGQACSKLNGTSESGQNSTSGACTPGPGTTGSPTTIEQAVALINGLPKPVTIPCFLQSLSRPLKISLTNNTVSAQPAAGDRSPRVFIFSGSLIISVVPDGAGSNAVEFGEQLANFRSIKGEVNFPVTTNLTLADPFEPLRYNNSVTVCAFCHTQEMPVTGRSYINAFSSTALQPSLDSLRPVSGLELESALCNSTQEPERCDMLRAIFNFGEVRSQSFPSNMPTRL